MPTLSLQKTFTFKVILFNSLALLVYFLCHFIPAEITALLYPRDSTFIFFPLLLLLITVYFYRSEGKTLQELGLSVATRQLKLLPMGMLIGLCMHALVMLVLVILFELRLSLNPLVEVGLMVQGGLFLISSVVAEELIFRGYCFDKTRVQFGVNIAMVVWALLFGVYHWFVWGLMGNVPMMLLALLTTGLGHWLFATALLKSGSLYLPVGIHWAWNLSNEYLWQYVSAQPAKADALLLMEGGQTNLFPYFMLAYFMVGLLVIWCINFYYNKKQARL